MSYKLGVESRFSIVSGECWLQNIPEIYIEGSLSQQERDEEPREKIEDSDWKLLEIYEHDIEESMDDSIARIEEFIGGA